MLGRRKAELVDLTRDEIHLNNTSNNNNRNPPDVITLDDTAQPDIIDVTDSDSESALNQTIPDRIPQPYRRKPIQPSPPRPESPSENSLKCPICIESYKNVRKRGIKIVVTRCGHLFCDFCLKKAMSENGRKCPKCRRNIAKSPTAIIEVFDVC